MRNYVAALIGAGMVAALAPAGAQTGQGPSAAPATSAEEQVEEILVTGRRSGAPMWRVTGPATSIVLVGGITGVSKTTKWDPEPLVQAMIEADRVMFPDSHAYTASPFSAIGWLAKWKAMATLPKDQKLADFVDAEILERLDALRVKGLAKKDFERRHPLHLAGDLRDDIEDELKFGPSLTATVTRASKKHKLEVVPVPRSRAKPVVKDLFASSPAEHVACLKASVALAEAGAQAVQARSDDWAARKVPEVLASPAEKPYEVCWPGSELRASQDEMAAVVRGLLDTPKVTIGVLSLRSLAAPGGVLDRLEAEGFDIEGPAWK